MSCGVSESVVPLHQDFLVVAASEDSNAWGTNGNQLITAFSTAGRTISLWRCGGEVLPEALGSIHDRAAMTKIVSHNRKVL